MTWVNLPIETAEGPLSRAEKAVLKLADGDACRVRTRDGEDVDATVDTSRGGCAFRDEDGESIEDVTAVWVSPAGGKSGKSGDPLSEEQRAERGIGRLNLRISQTAIDKLDRDASYQGCSRSKLIEMLILKWNS